MSNGNVWGGETPPGAEVAESRRVSLSTLITIRWFAITGQAVTVLVVQAAFAGEGWMWLPLAAVGALLAFNLVLVLGQGAARRLDGAVATWHLGFDVLQLSVLLYLTGGLHNPFAFFLLAPITVAAATLSLRRTALLVLLAVAMDSVLAVFHMPLPWPDGLIRLPGLYVAGTWTALVLSTVFAALYTWRMAEEARRRAAALSATQIALAHEQRFAAVGAMAAAVAHEMSTPLGTISLVAKEMASELPDDSPLASDVALLVSQADRCRTILAHLGQQRDAEQDATIDRMPLAALTEIAAAPHRVEDDQPALVFDARPEPGAENDPGPWVAQRPEILHGLGNLIQNALQFARTRVVVETRWNAEIVTVRVSDDGPGFPVNILGRIGEPYISTRAGEAGHMGLGIFIAGTLLARTGGKLHMANRPEGGAVATVVWPRAGFGGPPGV